MCVVDAPLGEALLMVFSAIVVKASNQRSESSSESVERHIGKGMVSRWLLRKTEELIHRTDFGPRISSRLHRF